MTWRGSSPSLYGVGEEFFSGSDAGGERAAVIYTIVETCKMTGLNPQAYLADIIDRIADPPANKIDELLPWNWTPRSWSAARPSRYLSSQTLRIDPWTGPAGCFSVIWSRPAISRLLCHGNSKSNGLCSSTEQRRQLRDSCGRSESHVVCCDGDLPPAFHSGRPASRNPSTYRARRALSRYGARELYRSIENSGLSLRSSLAARRASSKRPSWAYVAASKR
jgi:hypothetical protein